MFYVFHRNPDSCGSTDFFAKDSRLEDGGSAVCVAFLSVQGAGMGVGVRHWVSDAIDVSMVLL